MIITRLHRAHAFSSAICRYPLLRAPSQACVGPPLSCEADAIRTSPRRAIALTLSRVAAAPLSIARRLRRSGRPRSPTASPRARGSRLVVLVLVRQERYNAMWGALGSVDKNPTQKSTHAMTEAQIYGWMLERPQSRSMQRSASKWNRGKASCEIVSYADAYVTMAKCSPFAKAASNRS